MWTIGTTFGAATPGLGAPETGLNVALYRRARGDRIAFYRLELSLEREIEVRREYSGSVESLRDGAVFPQRPGLKGMEPTLEINLSVLCISVHIRGNEYVCRLATRRRGEGAGLPTVYSGR